MDLKYIPIILFLITLSIIIPGCKTSIPQCNSASPQDNFYCYVPRILPGSGVPMKWFPCGQNDKGAVHKSCRYTELDEECFIFVRADYKDGAVNATHVEVTPLKLIDKDPDKVDMTVGAHKEGKDYPIQYFYVNKRDLLDTKNQNIYQGKKIKVTYLFKDPFLAYQTATLYDSAFDGTLSPEVREKFTVDSVRKGCTRILGKSLCEKPEFAAARCNTIPCADFTQAKKFQPFDPTLFQNKYPYHDPNVYPLLKSDDGHQYIFCKGDKNRFAYVNFTITKNIDHIHQVKFTRNNVETIISLDPENKDSLNREYIRYCGTDDVAKTKRYVVKIPITGFRNNYVLYDKALEKEVPNARDIIYTGIKDYNSTRHLILNALNCQGLNIISEENAQIKSACRRNFSETLYDAFSVDNKTDFIHPIPYEKLNLGIYFSVQQKIIGNDTYFDTDGNLKIDAARYLQRLTRDRVKPYYSDAEHKEAIYAAMSATYMSMGTEFQTKINPTIFVANSVVLAEVIGGRYVKIRRTPVIYEPLRTPHDILKGVVKEGDNAGEPGLSGMTGPHFSWTGFDRSYKSTVTGVFKTLVPTLMAGGTLSANNCVAYTMIHELGHLWAAKEIMMEDRRDTVVNNLGLKHSYYCTGKNANLCVFRYDPTGGVQEQYRIFNRVGAIWCEGHKQLLLNINIKQIIE